MNTILEETISELGFQNLEDFIAIKLIEELQKKIDKYQNQIVAYQKKYEMAYSDFSKKYLSIKEIEDFEKEDDGSEWEWNLSAITILQKKIELVKNARNH